MSNERENEISFMDSEQDAERLQIPNGFRVSDEYVEVELVYDGEDVTFRSEEGELLTMGTLCYLDHVVSILVRDMVDEETGMEIPGKNIGHVICHMIQHLHGQYHMIHMQKRLQALRAGGGGGLAAMLAQALGGGMPGMEGDEGQGGPAVGAFVLGPNGLEPVDLSEPGGLAGVLGLGGEGPGEAVEGEFTVEDGDAANTDGEGQGGPVEEIIIGDIPRRKG